MPPRALLLDFDGVIADTENIHIAAWERTFEAMGWDVPPETCAEAAEADDLAFLAGVFAGRSIADGDVAGWVRRKQDLTRGMLVDSPRIYPGVAELIRRARGRVRLAVVSTTWRENIRAILEAGGLLDDFALLVGKEDVGRPKPDPECYRVALDRLGVAPGEAVALEDSPAGLASARGAGLRCVAVGHRRPARDWAGRAPFLADLTRTGAVLRALRIS